MPSVWEPDEAWIVERDGRAVAVLTDPHYVDMFWEAWRLDPLPGGSEPVFAAAYWDDAFLERTVFRHRATGAVAAQAFWTAGSPQNGRLIMRALYLPEVPRPGFWGQVRRYLGSA
jgi:hypothetical protein